MDNDVKGYQAIKRLSIGSVHLSAVPVRSSIGSIAGLSAASVAPSISNEERRRDV
jgi:hypothetical protein